MACSIRTVILLSAILHAVAAEPPAPVIPPAFRGFQVPPSAPLRFLASVAGRAYLQSIDHPLAPYAIRAFGAPTLVLPELNRRNTGPSHDVAAPAAGSCTGNSGARFNLEPRANAVPQDQPTVDFTVNGAGPGSDLIVEAANDWRGMLTTGTTWDQSVSGYYVHRSGTADCSTQFEGGLPSIVVQGSPEMGIGQPVVAADPARGAFFIADLRFGNQVGVALFRASSATLLSSTLCPSGTHTAAQAASCWTATPPAFLFAQPEFDLSQDQPQIAVDERASGTGTGAGDVYVVVTEFDYRAQTSTTMLVACTNALVCGAPTLISGSDTSSGLPYARVRPDGLLTISYIQVNSNGADSIRFVTCTPSGAPSQPVCAAATTVATVGAPLTFNNSVAGTGGLLNLNLTFTQTYPKFAHRQETGNTFTTFLVYDACKNVLTQGGICLASEVLLTTSTNNGATWSAPVSIDSVGGHHFFPSIATDASTGTVHIAYYTTAGDPFHHDVRVVHNQVAPGATAVGLSQLVTKTFDPIDRTPANQGFFLIDGLMSIAARGTGAAGASHVYTAFDSTAVSGTYSGLKLPEQNNSISLLDF